MFQAPAGVQTFFKPVWVRGLFALVGVAVLIAVFYYVRQYMLVDALLKKLPGDGVPITFIGQGFAERYTASGLSFTEEEPRKVGDVTVFESVQSPAVQGGEIVLASKSGMPGVILGLLKADGSFEEIVADGTNKTDLTITDNGTAVYASLSSPVFFIEDVMQDVGNDDAPVLLFPEETGTADGPPAGIPDSAVADATLRYGGMLFAVDLGTGEKKARSLGEGRSPQIADDGGVIAVTSGGIMHINPQTGVRTKIISYIAGDSAGSGISADGKLVALHRKNNSLIDVYRLVGNESAYLGSLFVSASVFGIALVDEQHIFIRNGKDRVSLYHVPENSGSVQPPSAHLRLITP